MRSFIIMMLSLLTTLPVAVADEDGRYEAVVIPQVGMSGQGANLNPKVFILDTRDGHLWTWSENEAIYQKVGPPRIGSVLIYQGKLRPGTKMGEIIDQSIDAR